MLYIIYIMANRSAAFFKQYHYKDLVLKIFSGVLIAGIKEANCTIGCRIASAFKIVLILIRIVIRIQLINRTNYFNYRIFYILVISVCADVLWDEVNKGFLYISACISNTGNGKLYP